MCRQIFGEQADEGIQNGRDFGSFIVGGELVDESGADTGCGGCNQRDDAREQRVEQQEEHGFKSDALETDGRA